MDHGAFMVVSDAVTFSEIATTKGARRLLGAGSVAALIHAFLSSFTRINAASKPPPVLWQGRFGAGMQGEDSTHLAQRLKRDPQGA